MNERQSGQNQGPAGPPENNTSLSAGREPELENRNAVDLYEIAAAVAILEAERLQQAGQLPRPSEIASKEAKEEYFNQLDKLYREACRQMRLPWP